MMVNSAQSASRSQADGIARDDGLIEFFGLLPNPDKE
jgi:hypothetical protein